METELQFQGGAVKVKTPTIDKLRMSAAHWIALAEIHFADAQANAIEGNLDTAIEQTRMAESKLATARATLIEARELEAMVMGS